MPNIVLDMIAYEGTRVAMRIKKQDRETAVAYLARTRLNEVPVKLLDAQTGIQRRLAPNPALQ